MKNLDLHIIVKEWQKLENLFKRNFRIYVKENFINQEEEKKHNLTNHILWFKNKIKLNQKNSENKSSTKWTIYYVDFGINIGSEINGVRPSIIYKNSRYSFGEDIIVIPMTSLNDTKSVDTFDVKIFPSKDNKLKHVSLIKTRQIKCVSKNRIGSYLGKITDDEIKDTLQAQIIKMFGMKI